MATRTLSTPPDNNTDANFRAWINEINNALIAFGWLATSDSGQINFSTVTRPTAASIYQGYAMYKMNDSLQSTVPVFLRIDFGTSASTDEPGIKFQVGIGATDGAGAITGVVMAQVTTGVVGMTPTGTSFNCRSSGSSAAFRMSFWSSVTANHGFTLMIERDKDTSGIDTAGGVNVIWSYITSSNAANAQSVFITPSTVISPVHTVWYALVTAQSSQSGGGNIGIAPVRIPLGPFRNPMLGALVCALGDYTVETTQSVTHYGSSHTYLMCRLQAGNNVNINGLNGACAFAMLWE
jgi:hypothetical protein